jgi:hypothetical protein
MSNLIHFPARKIYRFGESIHPEDLTEGQICFSVGFINRDTTLPVLETSAFVGRDLEPDDVDQFYFQDARSYLSNSKATLHQRKFIYSADKDEVSVHNFEAALDSLLMSELERRCDQTDPSTESVTAPSDSELEDPYIAALHEEIRSDPVLSSNEEAQKQFIADMRPLLFESRDLPPNPEPLPTRSLVKGHTYFLLEYLDEGQLTPLMDTVVFIGRNLGGEENKLYFQDRTSSEEGIAYDSPDLPDWATVRIDPEETSTHIFDLQGALEELMRCSLRRKSV